MPKFWKLTFPASQPISSEPSGNPDILTYAFPASQLIPWMRSSRVVRASDCQCRSRKSPEFNPSILRHSGIGGAADEAVLKKVHNKQ